MVNLKRFLDVAISLSSIVVLSPMILAVAIWIKVTSTGPVFFLQNRVGKHRKTFKIVKFRTMTHDQRNLGDFEVGAVITLEMRKNYETTGQNDHRITKPGFFLRKYHLDEIPQLINIIKGDMSIVGPRPDAPIQEIDYPPKHWEIRHRVLPGLTGLSQISENMTQKKRQKLDSLYVRKKTIGVDIYIMYKTCQKMFKGNSF